MMSNNIPAPRIKIHWSTWDERNWAYNSLVYHVFLHSTKKKCACIPSICTEMIWVSFICTAPYIINIHGV